MNIYEKSGLIREQIEDAEKRLGAYLWAEGCDKTNKYAQMLIREINACRRELNTMLKQPITESSYSE